jgi:hypothetical protein
MKKNHQHIWMTALAVVGAGGLGIYLYETFMATPTLAAGAISMATPSSGTQTFALPSGAASWGSASLQGTSGGPVTQAVPSAPGTAFTATGIVKGSILTIVWANSAGASQTSTITFT